MKKRGRPRTLAIAGAVGSAAYHRAYRSLRKREGRPVLGGSSREKARAQRLFCTEFGVA